jgi:hypothetical protein
MSGEQLHVVFCPSAAGTLRQALRAVGRHERVISPFDDQSFGPVDTDDAAVRAAWIESELGIADWRGVVEGDASVLSEARAAARPPIAWVGSAATSSLAGFLWWVSHLENVPVSVIAAPNMGFLNPDAMAALLDSETLLSDSDRNRHVDHWRELQAENAPYRVIEEGRLVSAPIDYFDRRLLSFVSHEWQKMARVVGSMLMSFVDDDVYQAGDLVLAARLAVLAETGVLEWQGDLSTMRGCELRLPSAARNGP